MENTYKAGISTFAGNKTPRIINHGLNIVPRVVMITQNENSEGYVGEYWYTADETNITVYNSGEATTGFAWVALK